MGCQLATKRPQRQDSLKRSGLMTDRCGTISIRLGQRLKAGGLRTIGVAGVCASLFSIRSLCDMGERAGGLGIFGVTRVGGGAKEGFVGLIANSIDQ